MWKYGHIGNGYFDEISAVPMFGYELFTINWCWLCRKEVFNEKNNEVCKCKCIIDDNFYIGGCVGTQIDNIKYLSLIERWGFNNCWRENKSLTSISFSREKAEWWERANM